MKKKQTSSLVVQGTLALVSLAREKAGRASRLLCRTCDQKGVKVSSWDDFEGMAAYVDGRIDEAQLTREARKEIEKHSETYGKYLLMDEERPDPYVSDGEKQRRAKRASRIYRNLCRNAGLTFCFFASFSAWSDFVEGRIDELEFLREVAVEAEGLGQEATH